MAYSCGSPFLAAALSRLRAHHPELDPRGAAAERCVNQPGTRSWYIPPNCIDCAAGRLVAHYPALRRYRENGQRHAEPRAAVPIAALIQSTTLSALGMRPELTSFSSITRPGVRRTS
jgi:hypothetical protein